MYDQLIELISNLGFPIAVSVYLLVRLEKKLDDLIKGFFDLTKVIQTFMDYQKNEES